MGDRGPSGTLPLAFARRHGIAPDPAAPPAEPPAPVTLLVREDCPDQVWREARRLIGRPISLRPCSEQTFLEALERVYGDRESGPGGDDLDIGIEIEDGANRARVTDLLDDATEAPVIQLINTLLRQALRRRASDMHVEAMEEGLRVRMRVDGVLRTVMERREAPIERVVSRLKVMARLDIAETRLPQDGRISLRFGGRAVDVRVSTMPSKNGERVVLRILDKSSDLLSLDEVGLSADERARVERMVAHPHGLMLVTGPTGSGKTTTLYSIIRHLDDNRRNILTVEDPVEYDLPGIGQTQVNAQVGMTFAASLRAILRQDPDIVLVGEIRDAETASIAVQAALTGHLVLSTLHTNTAVGAVTRLRDLGVEPFLLASTLRGVIAQRLVRRVCRACARPGPADDVAAALFRRHGLAPPDSLPEAPGCPACDHVQYAGRVGVYELIEIDARLRELIHDDRSEREIMEAALQPDARLTAAALRAAALGRTTLDEALRAVSDGG